MSSSHGRKPLARSDELVVEELDDELLVYDRRTNRAHCLSAPAARVWRACDGETSHDALALKASVDDSSLDRALDELISCELLDTGPRLDGGNGMTRRDVTIRTAKVGAAAASFPLIWSVMAPTPAAAVTPTPAQCAAFNNKSCSGCCKIAGCCCCCEGGGNCKLCYPTALCPSLSSCPAGGQPGCSCAGGALPPDTPCSQVIDPPATPACCGCTPGSNC